MKLASDSHQVSGHCQKGFSRSETRGQGRLQGHDRSNRPVMVGAYISEVWHQGSLISDDYFVNENIL